MSATSFGWLVLAFPLAGTIVISLLWRRLPGRLPGWIASAAILGSFLSASYRAGITPSLGALPEQARALAGESIGSTQLAAQTLPPPARAALEEAAVDAFVGGMHAAATGSAIVALLGALVVLRWLPGRRLPATVPPEVREPVGVAR